MEILCSCLTAGSHQKEDFVLFYIVYGTISLLPQCCPVGRSELTVEIKCHSETDFILCNIKSHPKSVVSLQFSLLLSLSRKQCHQPHIPTSSLTHSIPIHPSPLRQRDKLQPRPVPSHCLCVSFTNMPSSTRGQKQEAGSSTVRQNCQNVHETVA